MKNNKKAFTLLELILYTTIFILSSVIITTLFKDSFSQNQKSSMNIEFLKNVSSAEKYLRKASENVNGIVLISHKDDNTVTDTTFWDINVSNNSYNGYNYTLAELRDTCGFIINDNFDIVALKTVDWLDPVIIGVIEKETGTGRKYTQLAIYKYYSLFSQEEKIEDDMEAGVISPYLINGQYVSSGLNLYKCNLENGYLLEVSSKNYTDYILDYDYAVHLNTFKVLPYWLQDTSEGYTAGLIEYELGWVLAEKDVRRIIYQTISKVFNYE